MNMVHKLICDGCFPQKKLEETMAEVAAAVAAAPEEGEEDDDDAAGQGEGEDGSSESDL